MLIKLKDSRETIGAPPFCKHAGSRLLPNTPNIPNCGLVLKLARYRVSRALEASLCITESLTRSIYSLTNISVFMFSLGTTSHITQRLHVLLLESAFIVQNCDTIIFHHKLHRWGHVESLAEKTTRHMRNCCQLGK